ncbi:MAG: hypothetical protein WC604_01420 [Candidatus Gracilibacteria bacterium]
MTEPFEDIGKKVSELVGKHKEKERTNEAGDEELNKEIDALRKGIQSFLNEARDEKDKTMREEVLTSVIRKVSGESGVSISEITILLFPGEGWFFLQPSDKIKYGENPFLERLTLLNFIDRSPEVAFIFANKYKDQPYAAEVIRTAAERGKPRDALAYANNYKDQPYAAEVIRTAAERDPEAALAYANNYKDQPYAAEVIRTAAERDPVSALAYAYNYKDQPYAAEVIEKTVRTSAEIDSEAALEYANNYKDQPYAAEVIRTAAEIDPKAALEYANNYKDQPYAAEVIRTAAERYPGTALYNADKYKDQPYAAEVIRTAAEREPEAALAYADKYKDQPYAAEVIRTAAEREPWTALGQADKYKDQPYAAEVIRTAAEREPEAALAYADKYKDQPYAAEVIRTVAEIDPGAALEWADQYKDQPYAAEVIEKAARTSPNTAYKYRNDISPFLENAKHKDVQGLYAIIKQVPPYPEDVLYLSHYIVNGKMSIGEAERIVKNPTEFIKKLIELKNIPDAIGQYDAEEKRRDICLRAVHEVNDLHNEKDAVRFASVEKSSPEELYYLMTYGEEEIFTSSFNGFFNRLMQRLKTAGQSGYDLLKNTGKNKFRIFVKLCSNYGRLGEFLGTMEEAQKTEVIENFVSNLEKSKDFLAEAVTVADTFASLNDDKLLTQIQAILKREYERVQAEKSEEGIKLYGLLAGMFGKRAQIDAEWYAEMAKKYEMEDVSRLSAESLFNKDGSNVQQHFFYNDKDGIASFDHFMETYKKSAGWTIEEKDTFIIITKQKGSKKVVIYANKPQAEDEGIQDISKELKEKNVERIVAVHRGHSYHTGKTIENITSTASIVFLGSCGGYNNIAGVLSKSQKAHIIATKSTGTMLVNDPLLLILNEEILEGKDIEWQEFWGKAEDKLGKQKDFSSYVPPHKNLGVLFLKAYEKLEK